MKSLSLLLAFGAAVLTCAFFSPTTARADIIYSATAPPGVMQTDNNPCVIGDPSCDTNTKVKFPLPYTSSSSPCTNGNCDFFSPLYEAGAGPALPNIIPTVFDIGVDANIAVGQGPEVLQAFNVFACDSGGGGCTLYDSMGANVPVDLNYRSGTGYADGLLSNFLPLVSGDYYKFEATWTNDTGGQEQFWIIPAALPEPGTLLLILVGVGLLGLAASRRQHPAKS